MPEGFMDCPVAAAQQDSKDIHKSTTSSAWRAIKQAQVPSTKEPLGLTTRDNGRPDGVTLLPWSRRKHSMGCNHSRHLCRLTHRRNSSAEAGSAGNNAANSKTDKYADLTATRIFMPSAIDWNSRFLEPTGYWCHWRHRQTHLRHYRGTTWNCPSFPVHFNCKCRTPLHGHRFRTPVTNTTNVQAHNKLDVVQHVRSRLNLLYNILPATDTTNGQKFATLQYLDMSRCWAVALRCGKFVVELLWARPLVVSVAGVRAVEFGLDAVYFSSTFDNE